MTDDMTCLSVAMFNRHKIRRLKTFFLPVFLQSDIVSVNVVRMEIIH